MQTFQQGSRFGEWTVTETVTVKSVERVPVRCSCGALGSVIANSLGRGKSLKCASCSSAATAARTAEARRRALEYELLLPSRFPGEYRVWVGMVNRCHGRGPHKDYGGRGIVVCDRWANSFLAFLQDMGTRPGPDYTLDRVDVDGNYDSSNCRWATKAEQARNRRDNSGDNHESYRGVRAAYRHLDYVLSSPFRSASAFDGALVRLGEALCRHHGLALRSADSAL